MTTKEGPLPMQEIRSGEPDLTIIVKYWDDDGKATKKEYKMYSQVLATLSKFVDTALAVEMQEKDTRKIVMRDIWPEVFELAIKILTDPIKCASMTCEDAFKVAEFYDKFEFTGGIELCDLVMDRFLQKDMGCYKSGEEIIPDLDQMVDIIELAERFNLSKCIKSGVIFLKLMFHRSPGCRRGPVMLTVEHVKRLQSFFKARMTESVIMCAEVTESELDSSLFPKYFVEFFANEFSANNNKKKAIHLNGTKTGADGEFLECPNDWRFDADDIGQWNEQPKNFFVKKSDLCDRDWAIVCRDLGVDDDDINDDFHDAYENSFNVLWKSPFSRNLKVPPKGPWIPVDPLAKGETPIIISCEF